MTREALDSAFPPSDAQIAAAKAAGYSGWNGYFAGQNIYHGWADSDFQRVRAGGLATLAFCSGWANPTAMKIRGESLGIPIMLDCEGGIRGDGPWLQAWLDASGGGLYANYWVFPGKRAPRYMLCAYPTSGDLSGAAWSTVYGPRPGAVCGWQWAGSHDEFGVTVDSEWLDDGFYGLYGPGGGTIGGGFGTLTDIEIQARFVAVLDAIAGNREATNDINGALFYPTTDPNYGKFAQLFEDKVRAIVKAELDKLPASSGGTAPTNLTGTITGKLT